MSKLKIKPESFDEKSRQQLFLNDYNRLVEKYKLGLQPHLRCSSKIALKMLKLLRIEKHLVMDLIFVNVIQKQNDQ